MPPRPSSAMISYSPRVAWRSASTTVASVSVRRAASTCTVATPPCWPETSEPHRAQKRAPGAIATFLGLFTAGLAIALKDIVANLAGWAYIVWRRPFDVGDRVQIGPHAGDVIDLHLFQFTLNEIGNWVKADQSTGRIIHIPNGKVLSEPLANYDKGFRYIWNEIPVVISFESDWKQAKRLLEAIVVKHAEHLT